MGREIYTQGMEGRSWLDTHRRQAELAPGEKPGTYTTYWPQEQDHEQEDEELVLTQHVSSIFQHSVPKLRDPGMPTISCQIGGSPFDRSLLDLGASVNLLPYAVYKELRLGELKPTRITLQLADQSVKVPQGILEDLVVNIDQFSYLVDFVVLETEPAGDPHGSHTPVILGRPFLATANAHINCH